MNFNWPTRIDMMKDLCKAGYPCVAELGVFRGDFAKEIGRRCALGMLLLVDKWEGSGHSGDKDGKNVVYCEDLSEYYEKLKTWAKSKDWRVVILRKSTADFLRALVKERIEIFYIDADHSHDGVLADLAGCYANDPEWICGHNYNLKGVRSAVDWFAAQIGAEVLTTTDDLCPSYAIKVKGE